MPRPRPTALAAPVGHRRTSGQRTRDKLLDAAENLFAIRGFYGVSIRDITQAAGVQLALASYHFGSKQQLYTEVVRRRGVAHAAGMQERLDRAQEQAGPGGPSYEAVIEAFCSSILDRLTYGGPGWNSYIRLLARSAESQQSEEFVTAMNEVFDPVTENYVKALRKALPTMAKVDLYAGFYLLQAALVYVVANTGGIDRLSRGALRSREFQKILPRMVRYASAGFGSLAQELPTTKRPRRKPARARDRP